MKNIITNRRTVRNFDANHQMSNEEIIKLLDDAQRSPSMGNFQPWRFVVANTKESKEKMKEAMFGNFLQFDTASAIFLVLNDKLAYVDAKQVFKTSHDLGLMPHDVMERQIEFANSFAKVDKNYYQAINFYDIGLVSMNLVTLARINGYEASIMRGYNEEKMLEVVAMDPKRYSIVSIIAIGKALEEGFPSYRYPATKTTKFL